MKPTNVIKTLAFAILGGYVFGSSAQVAGLDCTKAKSKVERLICDEKKNPGLYSLDSRLNTFYVEALQKTEDTQRVIEDQKKWIKAARNVCNDAACLRQVYQSRVSELQEAATLCNAQEVVVFSCTLLGKKVVSLCASQDASPNAGYMQYRLGRNQNNLEMQFPEQKSLAKKFFKHYGDGSTDIQVVSFWSGDNRFSVFDTAERLATYDPAGLIVSQGRPPVRVSYSECVRKPVVFSQYQKYSSITIYSLGKILDLPDAEGDMSYMGADDVSKQPGDLED